MHILLPTTKNLLHTQSGRKKENRRQFLPQLFSESSSWTQQVSSPSSFDCITPHTRPRRRDVVTGGADSYIDSEERGGGGFRSASKDASSLSTTTCALSSTFVDKIFRLRKYLQDAKKHRGTRWAAKANKNICSCVPNNANAKISRNRDGPWSQKMSPNRQEQAPRKKRRRKGTNHDATNSSRFVSFPRSC